MEDAWIASQATSVTGYGDATADTAMASVTETAAPASATRARKTTGVYGNALVFEVNRRYGKRWNFRNFSKIPGMFDGF